MFLTEEEKNKLVNRINSTLALKQVWEPIGVIVHKKGKNIDGVSLDENGQPLKPEKVYDVESTPRLAKIKHHLKLKIIIDECKSLEELHERLNEYVEKHSSIPDAKIKWPEHLKLCDHPVDSTWIDEGTGTMFCNKCRKKINI